MAKTTFSGPVYVTNGIVNAGGKVTAVKSGVLPGTAVKSASPTATTICTIPAGAQILDVLVDVTTALSGNSISKFTLELGDGSDADRFFSLADITVAKGGKATAAGRLLVDAVTAETNVVATGTGDQTATAGSVTITVVYAV